MKSPLILGIIALITMSSCTSQKNDTEGKAPFPRVMTTYRMVKSFDQDFSDLKDHGIEAVDIGNRYSDDFEILKASRKYGIKLMSRLEVPQVEPDGIITYQGLDAANAQTKQNKEGFIQEIPESAVMIGGAYKGKAIDRFTFSFKASPQKIILEAPIYHRDEVYGDYGHYFPGMIDPEKIEIIVKKKNYDGHQHLNILPASHTKIDEHHWEVEFDLSGVEGDLNDVVISAYWILHASINKFRNNPTAYASSTLEEMKRVTRDHIAAWKALNGGTYPEEIIALRIGDEEWHRAAHTSTSQAVSYPVWDYSETAIKVYQKLNPGEEYPRGQNFAHIFGRRAQALWLYSYHKGKTEIVRAIKEALKEEGLERVKLYRNITRGDVFSTQNDHDGTGLELLSEAFDIIHLDPYPVRKSGYTHDILVDMGYMAGFSRRFKKPLIPWIQAHQYYPEGYFGLTHPTPAEMEKMIGEHLQSEPDGMMWLGYGPGTFNTFPEMRPDSWAKASELHARFTASLPEKTVARIAVIRPYTVRALRDEDRVYPQDYFFTETIIKDLILNKKDAFNPYEPVELAALNPSELKHYDLVFSELGILNETNLAVFKDLNAKIIIFIEGCEREELAQQITGIKGFMQNLKGDPLAIEGKQNGLSARAVSADAYELDNTVQILSTHKGLPVIWQKDNLIFVSARSLEGDYAFADFIWKIIQ